MRDSRRIFSFLSQTAAVIFFASLPCFGGDVHAEVSINREEAKLNTNPTSISQHDIGNNSSSFSNLIDEEHCSSSDAGYELISECGLWLAPSTIPGSGLGMFAGRDFKKNDKMQLTGDVVIPVIDFLFNHKESENFLWDEYTWAGSSVDMEHEGINDVNAASPGFGSAANSFLDLFNVDEKKPTNTIPQGMHRSKDPGVGAFSSYHNRLSVARLDIKAGQELFVDYGQHWFENRPSLGPIPLFGQLEEATNLFGKFHSLKKRFPKLNPAIWEETWEIFMKGTSWNESRIIGAFKHTHEEVKKLENSTLYDIRVEESTRDDRWLRDHGTCADNIRAGPSTIRQAGNGAFATRHLRKGMVLAQLPMVHLPNRTVLDIYKIGNADGKATPDKTKVVSEQMILNYCFGHNQSTMLLCPYGPMTNLINHNQTLSNVKLRWGNPNRGNHQPQYLNMSVATFQTLPTSVLAMELVVTRDIQKNEEVFLDYGNEWEEAWFTHVLKWKPVPNAAEYVSASEFNKFEGKLRTEFEQLMDPYPGNIKLKCDMDFMDHIDAKLYKQSGKVVRNEKFQVWTDCELLQSKNIHGRYLYKAYGVTHNGEDGETDKDKVKKLQNVPREAFRFVDRPYTTDLFMENVFRHEMMIPDDIFPEEWKNKK